MQNQTEILFKIPEAIPTFQTCSLPATALLCAIKSHLNHRALTLVTPNRDYSLLVHRLSNAQNSSARMPDTWTSLHVQQPKIFVSDSHPEIASLPETGERWTHNLNAESIVTIISLARCEKETKINFNCTADQSQDIFSSLYSPALKTQALPVPSLPQSPEVCLPQGQYIL